ncbi:TPA: ribulose-phosphate 3-epimerase [Candidatus Poribacteria bacterium]|nr:ribulose-phosphate 3-epimerase [Candidatus Poribacteria bacterium]HCK12888.1 ribulose-phosphate 3-epimerase [Candidatus Poribacteria bacterium]|tara:strand:- start:1833 stop:2501 length:669 start_codon:yes stop_codon:yes gene_type:complete
MCADLCNLESDIKALESVGVDLLHFDLMDAHFVPNMPIGLELLSQLRPKTDCPYDVHLMVEDNDFFISKLSEIGVQQITVHAESAIHLDRTLGLIRDYGIKAGLALNPATPIDTITYVLDRIDYILIMTVNPGFAGQSMVPSALQKIADCQEFLQQRGLPLPIEVDGNVSFENIPKMVGAGANILVAGSSSIFNQYGSRLENVELVREAISQGLQMRNQHGQ